MQLPDGRDGNFVCKNCGGDIVHIKNIENERKVFRCNGNNPRCNSEMLECGICNLPKTIWADDGMICGGCCLRWMAGEIEFTQAQIDGINKWRVIIPLR